MNSAKRNSLAIMALHTEIEQTAEFLYEMEVEHYTPEELKKEHEGYNDLARAINSFRKLKGGAKFREEPIITMKEFKELFRGDEELL